ncbi:MAG: DUF6151 family protein [Ruegeria sp.]
MSGKTQQPCDLVFSCHCGAVQGHITASGVKSGTHVACFCKDCRAAQLYFQQPDPAPGPVDILQTTPEDIVFESGADRLGLMQLSPKGMPRWYATCCNTPIATTTRTPKFPFVGFLADRLRVPDKLGPVKVRGFVPGPGGKQSHQGVRHAITGLLSRVVKSRLSGRWKDTPFFNIETGTPVVPPVILSKEQRTALYD